MYRTFSVIIIIFALFGGGYAGYEFYKNVFAEENPVDLDKAKGFAAAFARAYLTIENGNLATLADYTDLADQRKIVTQVGVDDEEGSEINQKVIGIWPIKAEILAGNHINVQLITLVEREIPNKNGYEDQLNKLVTYQMDVPVTQGLTGYKVLQYPKMAKVEKDDLAEMPKLGTTDSQAELGMKPMLVSFFKTYFEGQSKEDIMNFFMNAMNIPSPQKGLFLFEEMDLIQAFSGDENQWLVLINLRVRDSYTNISYPFSYVLNVVRDGEKYYILSFNE